MCQAAALLAVLAGGPLFAFAEEADFELELEEALIPLERVSAAQIVP
jgi:hypothetical protein